MLSILYANHNKNCDDVLKRSLKQSELKAAELSLAAEKKRHEGEKASLLEQKKQAEREARAAAVAEAAYKEKRASANNNQYLLQQTQT